MRPNFSLFFFFALIATLCDQVWVRLGVLVYPHPFRFGQAWWVPLLFGTVALIIVHFFVIATRLLLRDSTPQPKDPGGHAIIAAAWFAAAYLGGGLFDGHSRKFALLLLLIWVIRLGPASNSIREALVLIGLSLIVAVVGTLGESAAGWLNLMFYPRPDFCRVPYWLPVLWLQAALLARELSRAWFWGR